MKTIILGSGSWGTALGQVLADNGHSVTIWGRNKDVVEEINKGYNSKYFNQQINKDLSATTNLHCVKNADIILLAIPSIAMESTLKKINELLDHKVIFINTAKGFHPESKKLLTDVIKENINDKYIKEVISLIGPSHAENVIKRQITTINAVSEDAQIANQIQIMFSNNYFRVYHNDDIIGSQIGVALKNIIAIASGIAYGLELGDNAHAALITRGLAEITRFGKSFGAKPETFLGLCGVGDLVATASSFHSRNFQAGLSIAKNKSSLHLFEKNTKTIEGVYANKVVYDLSKQYKISMPINQAVYEVIYRNKSPEKIIKKLMLRDLKKEI